jgi:undecaprenyl diphosphate synthase
VSAIERTVSSVKKRRIPYLSLYAFSTENWKRSKEEVNGLMGLIRFYLLKKARQLKEENVRLRFAGRINDFSDDIRSMIRESEKITEDCNDLQLILCLNYGGRQEILDAVNRLIQSGYQGEITESHIKQNMYLPDVPDPDLIIRTSGELRLSNFWLWQSSYSELYFTEILWPDFNEEQLEESILSYKNRERRYGSRKV